MKNLALLFICIVMIACTKASDPNSEIQTIRTQLEEIAAMSALDRPTSEMTDEYLRYFATEPTLQPADGDSIHGRDAIARFYNEAFDKFLAGEYAGAYEDALIAKFEALLPETPPWQLDDNA